MNRKLLATASALVALLFSGCMHNYQFDIRATNSARLSPPPSSYRLKVASVREPADSARTLAAEERLRHALSAKGLVEAPADGPADLLVLIDYSIGSREARMVQHGDFIPPSSDEIHQSRGDTSGRFTYVTDQVITYTKSLTITAYENRPVWMGRGARTAWRVEASIDDESADLAKYVPLLAEVSSGYIDTSVSEKTAVLSPGFGI